MPAHALARSSSMWNAGPISARTAPPCLNSGHSTCVAGCEGERAGVESGVGWPNLVLEGSILSGKEGGGRLEEHWLPQASPIFAHTAILCELMLLRPLMNSTRVKVYRVRSDLEPRRLGAATQYSFFGLLTPYQPATSPSITVEGSVACRFA